MTSVKHNFNNSNKLQIYGCTMRKIPSYLLSSHIVCFKLPSPLQYRIGSKCLLHVCDTKTKGDVYQIKARFENKTNSSHLDQPDWVYPVQQKIVASSRYLVKQATILSLRCSQFFSLRPLGLPEPASKSLSL